MFLFIIAPMRVDIGYNVEFKGSFWANSGLTVSDHYFHLLNQSDIDAFYAKDFRYVTCFYLNLKI